MTRYNASMHDRLVRFYINDDNANELKMLPAAALLDAALAVLHAEHASLLPNGASGMPQSTLLTEINNLALVQPCELHEPKVLICEHFPGGKITVSSTGRTQPRAQDSNDTPMIHAIVDSSSTTSCEQHDSNVDLQKLQNECATPYEFLDESLGTSLPTLCDAWQNSTGTLVLLQITLAEESEYDGFVFAHPRIVDVAIRMGSLLSQRAHSTSGNSNALHFPTGIEHVKVHHPIQCRNSCVWATVCLSKSQPDEANYHSVAIQLIDGSGLAIDMDGVRYAPAKSGSWTGPWDFPLAATTFDRLDSRAPSQQQGPAHNAGIVAIEYYAPNHCVAATDVEEAHKMPGRYSTGQGKNKITFCSDDEDTVSMAMTAFQRLMDRCKIDYNMVSIACLHFQPRCFCHSCQISYHRTHNLTPDRLVVSKWAPKAPSTVQSQSSLS